MGFHQGGFSSVFLFVRVLSLSLSRALARMGFHRGFSLGCASPRWVFVRVCFHKGVVVFHQSAPTKVGFDHGSFLIRVGFYQCVLLSA